MRGGRRRGSAIKSGRGSGRGIERGRETLARGRGCWANLGGIEGEIGIQGELGSGIGSGSGIETGAASTMSDDACDEEALG